MFTSLPQDVIPKEDHPHICSFRVFLVPNMKWIQRANRQRSFKSLEDRPSFSAEVNKLYGALRGEGKDIFFV